MGIKKSFTLIEIIVVVGIFSLVLPVLFTIFYVLIQEQLRIYGLQEVKKQGDTAITFIRDQIKNNAILISSDSLGNNKVCINTGPEYTPSSGILYFQDKTSGTYFAVGGVNGNAGIGYIKYNPPGKFAATETEYLVNNINIGNFSISCKRTNLFAPPIIYISLSMSKGDIPPLYYRTAVKLNTY